MLEVMKSMLLLVAALVDAKTTDSNAIHRKVGDFDFYVFSMGHQPEFCRGDEGSNQLFWGCHSANDKVTYKESWEGQLTIHGLWPQLYNGSHPTMCTNEQLNPTLLAGLEVAMEQNWTNIRHINTKSQSSTWSYDDTSFWSHEWHNHGTCSGMDQYTYFSTALQLLVPTPPIVKERYCSNGGVGVVTRSELLAGYSFTMTAGVDLKGEKETILSCSDDGYLSEVLLCYEKKNITHLHHRLSPHDGGKSNVGKRIMCPYKIMDWEDNCGETIKIASFIQPNEKAILKS